MIWIVSLPFAALAVAIIVVRVMRGARQFEDIRARRQPLTLRGERRTPSDDYHDHTWLPLCESIAGAAADALHRTLTAKERRTIWRARSALVLEVALRELHATTDPQTIAGLLAVLPTGMDRPDPTGWCDAGS